jgi:alanine dehydrogenase
MLIRDAVTQLADVLAGTAVGRGGEAEITVFDSTGLAIQDIAMALAAVAALEQLESVQLGP